jgi:lipopolysaccharide/colanic/teichoic acid biosynthesis glycosyltransferase
MIKRIFDFCFALIGVISLLPLFVVIGLIICIDSKGGVVFIQRRIGRNAVEFPMFKFRTMRIHTDNLGLLTVGSHDIRITKCGYWLRKFKLDELPQLFNVLAGHMSFVGPRPEVRRYVEYYNRMQKRTLLVKPGITDWASINYFNENDLLSVAESPEQFYINEILPVKAAQNLEYINHHNLWIDLEIIFLTIKKIVLK